MADNENGRDVLRSSRKKSGPLGKNQKLLLNIILVVCLGVVLVSGTVLIKNAVEHNADRDRVSSDFDAFLNPSSTAVSVTSEGSVVTDPYANVTFPVGILESMKSFYARNSELVGFLVIDGIDGFGYPVVQTDDNEKYYRKDLDLKSSREGTAFVDCTVDLNNTRKNLLIHGHNNKNGLMFGPLEKYNALLYGLDLYEKAPVITYYTLYDKIEYKIVGFVIANTKWADGPTFDYTVTDLSDQATFETFANEVARRTVIKTGVDLQYGDDVMTLHSCAYYFKNVRFLVIARALRPGEDAAVDASAAVINTNAVCPDTFVDAYNVGIKASEASALGY